MGNQICIDDLVLLTSSCLTSIEATERETQREREASRCLVAEPASCIVDVSRTSDILPAKLLRDMVLYEQVLPSEYKHFSTRKEVSLFYESDIIYDILRNKTEIVHSFGIT